MGRVRRSIAVFALVAGVFFAPAWSAFARQDDPRLDPLFTKLQAVATTDDESDSIVEQIWTIWLQSGAEKVDGLMSLGVLAMSKHDLDTALIAFNEMVTMAPDFAEAWNKRATVHYMMGNYEASLADVEKTLALEPRHFGALAGLGLIHLANGDERQALAAFERGLRVNPHMRLIKMRVRELRDRVQGRPI